MHWILLVAAALLAAAQAVVVVGATAGQSSTFETRRYTLYVRDGWIPTADGGQIYVWGFTDDPDGGPKIPGPPIVANEGDMVEVVLINDRDPTANPLQPEGEGHTIHLHGLDVPTDMDGVPETHPAGLVRQGGSFTYRFTATHAGTYFYHCHQNNVEHQQMGMYGPIVIHAAGGARAAYTGGPAFDWVHTLTLADMQPEGHDAARRAIQEQTAPHNWVHYQPSYLFVNESARPADQGAQIGPFPPRGGEDQAAQIRPLPPGGGGLGRGGIQGATVATRPGQQRGLVRVINAGYVARAVHSHGAPFEVVATDGRAWPEGPTTNLVWLGPGEKYDLLVTGEVALHDHPLGTYTGPVLGGPARGSSQVGVSSQIGVGLDRPASAFTLYIRPGELALPDGERVPVYGFTDDPAGSASVPGPLLEVTEGSTVEITLVNDASPTGRAHRLSIPDLSRDDGPTVMAGERAVFRFVADRAGSYLYVGRSDAPDQEMGMYGGLLVRPASGQRVAYTGGPAYDRDYTMVLSEVDSLRQPAVWAALSEGRPTPARPYAANYFLINGRAYPDVESDPASMVRAVEGERILLRMLNAGRLPHAMHLHGYHFRPVAVAGTPWQAGPLKDTILLAPGESIDLLFVADQRGLFPFHDHFETANTNNGVWLGGMHTMVATGVEHHAPGAHPPSRQPGGPTVAVRDNFYAPNQIVVPVGSTVRWEHQGQVEHTVSSIAALFDSGPLVGGDVFEVTFSTAGRYDYFCRFHITNRGVVLAQ